MLFFAAISACAPDEDPDPVLGTRDLADIPVTHTFAYPADFDFERTQADIRTEWGEPEEMQSEEVRGTGADEDINYRHTLRYPGVEFVFFEETGEPADGEQKLNLMVATVIRDPEFALDNGLRVGMLHSEAEDIVGNPIFAQGASHVYSVGDSPTSAMSIELVVVGDRVSELVVSPDFP